eukprot:5547280-Prymnesium_polylepis.2
MVATPSGACVGQTRCVPCANRAQAAATTEVTPQVTRVEWALATDQLGVLLRCRFSPGAPSAVMVSVGTACGRKHTSVETWMQKRGGQLHGSRDRNRPVDGSACALAAAGMAVQATVAADARAVTRWAADARAVPAT